jgi:hypothetical protein
VAAAAGAACGEPRAQPDPDRATLLSVRCVGPRRTTRRWVSPDGGAYTASEPARVDRADYAPNDPAAPVEEEPLGQAGHAAVPRDGVRSVPDVQIADVQLLHKGARVVSLVVRVEADEDQPGSAVRSPGTLEPRSLGPARRAPGGPHVGSFRRGKQVVLTMPLTGSATPRSRGSGRRGGVMIGRVGTVRCPPRPLLLPSRPPDRICPSKLPTSSYRSGVPRLTTAASGR